ncbi:MAG: CPBP family intramembrane glutamic endopeptidase [Candidatus Nanoperiomorbaceae bacterium]
MKITHGFDQQTDLADKRQAAQSARRHDFWRRKFWPIIGWCVYFFVAFIASQCLVALVVLALSRLFGFDALHLSDPANALVDVALYALLLFLFVGLPIKFVPKIQRYFIAKRNKIANSDALGTPKNQPAFGGGFLALTGLARPPRWHDVGWTLYWWPLFYLILIGAMMAASALFGAATMRQTQTIAFTPTASGAELIIIGLALCVVTPIAEEILLRGFLLTKIRQCFGQPIVGTYQTWFGESRVGDWLSAVIVSIVFALAHGQLNVGVMTFILSMVNAHLRKRTGAIYSGILLHAAVNFLAFGIRYLGFLHGLA